MDVARHRRLLCPAARSREHLLSAIDASANDGAPVDGPDPTQADGSVWPDTSCAHHALGAYHGIGIGDAESGQASEYGKAQK
jgi:hypothetical protein